MAVFLISATCCHRPPNLNIRDPSNAASLCNGDELGASVITGLDYLNELELAKAFWFGGWSKTNLVAPSP